MIFSIISFDIFIYLHLLSIHFKIFHTAIFFHKRVQIREDFSPINIYKCCHCICLFKLLPNGNCIVMYCCNNWCLSTELLYIYTDMLNSKPKQLKNRKIRYLQSVDQLFERRMTALLSLPSIAHTVVPVQWDTSQFRRKQKRLRGCKTRSNKLKILFLFSHFLYFRKLLSIYDWQHKVWSISSRISL